MTDFIQLQSDLCAAALSNGALSNLNVKQWRKLRLQSEVDLATIWLEGRNGRSGVGAIVELPEFDVQNPNLPGPEAFLLLSFLILEEPNINFTPDCGTLVSAEQYAQLFLEIFHDYQVEGFGTLFAAPKAIAPVEDYPGIVGYRVTFRARVPREQTARVATPALSEAAGTLTITCATSGADIYYTNDGSCPGSGNDAAQLYSAPFSVAVGEVIRAAAYKTGAPGSHVTKQTVT